MPGDYQIQIRSRIDAGTQSDPLRSATTGSQSVSHNLAARFLDCCHRYSANNALSDIKLQKYSYRWLRDHACRVAVAIERQPEFRRGTHVGLHFENSLEYVVAFYGTLLAGGVVVPIPYGSSTDRLVDLCRIADVSIFLEPSSKNLRPFGNLSYAQPLEIHDQPPFDFEERAFSCADSLAILLFTSGSSGGRKAVMLSHRNLTANADSILKYLPVKESDRTLAVAPFTHALGNSVLQTHVLAGAELHLNAEVKYASEFVSVMNDQQCSSLVGVPEVIGGVASWVNQNNLPSLRYLAVAGGRLDPTIVKLLGSRQDGPKLFVMYGQTEATARLSYLPPTEAESNPGSIGIAIPDVELKIVDESGQHVGDGEVGTLMAKGPNVMMGYFRDCDATQQVLEEGWLNTGDLAKQNIKGLYEICGRKNSLVKVLGHRFHPNEVEQVISQAVEKTQIVVEPFDFYGNTRIALFARPIEGKKLRETELKSICRELLPTYMVPQRFQVIQHWPLNSAGKINRKSLTQDLTTNQPSFEIANP